MANVQTLAADPLGTVYAATFDNKLMVHASSASGPATWGQIGSIVVDGSGSSYALLTNFNARATYRLAPWVRVYGSFNVENESYFRVGRVDDRFVR